jgi:luciferase family oxidoreductase group 1
VQSRLLGRAPGDADRFADDVRAVLALLDGTWRPEEGVPVVASPAGDPQLAEGVQVWLHGSSPGVSAQLAGGLGLRFGANYHVAPARVVEAVAAYRAAFRPSAQLAAPHVVVSADVVVAGTDAEARELAAGYGAWVWSIRKGDGAIPFPTPSEAAAAPLRPDQLADVQDRLDTQLVGSPRTVTTRLEALARLTGADELLVTTTTHEHAATVRSYELLAAAWGGGAGAASPPGATS